MKIKTTHLIALALVGGGIYWWLNRSKAHGPCEEYRGNAYRDTAMQHHAQNFFSQNADEVMAWAANMRNQGYTVTTTCTREGAIG